MAYDATVLELQAIAGALTVDGVTMNAPEDYPDPVNSSMLPMCLTFMGQTHGSKFGTTTYVQLVMIAITASVTNPNPVFSQGNAFLKAMRAAYLELGGVNGAPFDMSGNPSSNGGFGSPKGMMEIIEFIGAKYYGYQFNVTVQGRS